MNLNTGGLRAQENVGLAADRSLVARSVKHVEGVLHAAAGMVGRRIQGREVVPVGLDLGTGGNHIAKAQEDVADLVGDAVDQMTRADLLRAAGHRDVDCGSVDGSFELGCSELGLALFQRRLDRVANLVHGLANRSALFLRDVAHVAQVASKRAGLAHDGHAHFVERGSRLRRLDRGKRLDAQLGELISNCHAFAFPFRKTKKSLLPTWRERRLPNPVQGRKKALAVPPWLTRLSHALLF